MKTLVIQLARLGDILQTLPALSAYCRANKKESVHLLVRKKFAEIAHILPVCNKVIEMDTKVLLEPTIMTGDAGVEDSLQAMQQWVDQLVSEGYTKIINLSFSPFSSYLTSLLTTEGVEVVGYTRHTDGFLAIPDDASAYFYGQVGVNRSNRFHLIDLFSSILGVEILESDWNIKKITNKDKSQGYIAFHVGASNPKKALSASALTKLLKVMVGSLNEDIHLLGAKEDIALAASIEQQVCNKKIKNLVGKTTLTDLIDVVAGANLFIGADSGPMQICNLTDTMCINFSNEFV
ncbi:MAG: glycosyltransferase family 9 protein, partial [Bdellovibrionales bacterium]|nr:glycosyltransferase family 9 protein [Bdellovibrionales bacterium]